MTKDNDIMSEGYGQDIPEPKQPVTTEQKVVTFIVLACFAALVVAGTVKIIQWLF